MTFATGLLKVTSAVIIVVALAFTASYLLPQNIIVLEDTEAKTLDMGLDEDITVDMPKEYIQMPTLRFGLPFRISLMSVDDPVAKQIAEQITERVSESEGDDWDKAVMVAKLVHLNVDYEEDNLDHWKLPWETLRDGKGDCEDYAILTKAILDEMGLDSIFIMETNHMTVGVYTGSEAGYGLEVHGKFYQTLETMHSYTPGDAKLKDMYLTMSSGWNIFDVIELAICFILIAMCSYVLRSDDD